jgi:valyl-tRNA synthetase
VGDAAFVDEVAPLLKSVMGRVSEVKTFSDDAAFSSAAAHAPVAVAGATKLALVVPIDIGSERARIGKEIDRLQGETAKAEAKLNNPSFVQRAPAAVVEQERQRVADFRQALRRLEDQLDRLAQSA